MTKVFLLILGIVIIIIGFRAYSYFNRNLEMIDNEPGNLFGIAALLIIIGIFITIVSVINFF
ncbi:hypothetical protein [Psychroserpens mesophilus]|uniref:hypothetical protein n=1 Tax=Psychroserpens mesophilus TaxID=325473 RepID=UPI00058C3CEA|nr:hypothetical protein [Psychroserpens mesophilus]